jgi:hypothetical protein
MSQKAFTKKTLAKKTPTKKAPTKKAPTKKTPSLTAPPPILIPVAKIKAADEIVCPRCTIKFKTLADLKDHIDKSKRSNERILKPLKHENIQGQLEDLEQNYIRVTKINDAKILRYTTLKTYHEADYKYYSEQLHRLNAAIEMEKKSKVLFDAVKEEEVKYKNFIAATIQNARKRKAVAEAAAEPPAKRKK